VNSLVLGALRALDLGPRQGEIELVANALRNSDDPEVRALLSLPEAEGWERVRSIALDAGLSGFVALDLLTEAMNPGAHIRVLARGWPDTEDA